MTSPSVRLKTAEWGNEFRVSGIFNGLTKLGGNEKPPDPQEVCSVGEPLNICCMLIEDDSGSDRRSLRNIVLTESVRFRLHHLASIPSSDVISRQRILGNIRAMKTYLARDGLKGLIRRILFQDFFRRRFWCLSIERSAFSPVVQSSLHLMM